MWLTRFQFIESVHEIFHIESSLSLAGGRPRPRFAGMFCRHCRRTEGSSHRARSARPRPFRLRHGPLSGSPACGGDSGDDTHRRHDDAATPAERQRRLRPAPRNGYVRSGQGVGRAGPACEPRPSANSGTAGNPHLRLHAFLARHDPNPQVPPRCRGVRRERRSPERISGRFAERNSAFGIGRSPDQKVLSRQSMIPAVVDA